MKKTLLFYILSMLLFSQIAFAKNNEIFSGIFTYKIEGDIENGTEIFSFANNKTYRHRKTTIAKGNIKVESDMLEIDDGKSFYIINLLEKTGSKVSHPSSKQKSESEEREWLEQTRTIRKKFFSEIDPIVDEAEIKKSSEITFFGKRCKVITGKFFKVYKWFDFILRHEITSPFKKLIEVTDMKVNIKIPETRFIPPENITYTNLNMEQISAMIKAIMSSTTNKNK